VTGVVVLIAAAGAGERLGGREPKAFVTVGGIPLFLLAVEAARSAESVDRIVVAVQPGTEDRALGLLAGLEPVPSPDEAGQTGRAGAGRDVGIEVVAGRATRQGSVGAALDAVEGAEVILCHDAARPFAPPQLFDAVAAAVRGGAAGVVPVVPVPDTVKRVRDGVVVATEPRDELALAQTPQGFRADVLRDAHRRAAEDRVDVTDDAALVEWAGHRVEAVMGDPANFKITTPDDLIRAEETLVRDGRPRQPNGPPRG
jgi:2-C-methyl-D-erythritol 4-phosphate cytidylyltransferase